MADIGLFSFYGGFPRLELLNDVNIGIIRFYGRIERCMTFAECRPQTADCKCHTPRIELRDLLGYCWQSVSRARRDTSYNDPYRQAPPRKWYFFQPSNFVYLKWGMKKWISRGSLPFKGRYTRGILLPEHAPGARSGSTLREHSPGANFLRVYQRFHGYNSSSGAEPMTSSGWPASSVG